VRAVLDVLIGPEAGCSIVVTFVEQRVESEQTSAPGHDQLAMWPPSTLRTWPVMIVISHVFEHLALAVTAYRSRETPGAFDLGSQELDAIRGILSGSYRITLGGDARAATRFDDHHLELWRKAGAIEKIESLSRVTLAQQRHLFRGRSTPPRFRCRSIFGSRKSATRNPVFQIR
jgi:hypothetical protein